MTKLTKKEFTQYEKAKEILGAKESKVIDRIDYILRSIYTTFGCEVNSWWFCGAPEGELGDLSRAIGRETVSGWEVRLDKDTNSEMIIMLEGCEYDLWEFPKRWLFEDFEEELSEGYKAYIKHIEEKKKRSKARREARKKEKKKALEAAKKKLTAAERKALGIK